ncbi:MAG: hypothetical protein A2Y70_00625 [Candidatus Aminicenantes bacterium RBG_13_64_14]|nr:MAG: hypothetical protein A2Y70_00625 [Candidatus Aminicenantes bacterium RBG_13_64_14]
MKALVDLRKLSGEETKKEIRDTALTTEGKAKGNLIANKSVITGTLLRSITTELLAEGYEGEVGTVVEYAPYVEFGHRGRRTIGGEEVGGFLVRAKPYLGPAFEDAIAGLLERLRARLKGGP